MSAPHTEGGQVSMDDLLDMEIIFDWTDSTKEKLSPDEGEVFR